MEPNGSNEGPKGFETKVFRGGRALVASQIARFILRGISTLAVTRLLTPFDYGVFGMSIVLYGMVYSVRDLGLLTVSVSEGKLSEDQANQLFWTNAGIGLGLAGVFLSLGPHAAEWYHEPRLPAMFEELAACFVLNGLGNQYQVRLSRELRFGALSVVEVVSMAFSIAVAIGCALAGFGYWALVHMTVAAELARTVGVAICARWLPSWPRQWRDAARFLRSGTGVAGFAIVSATVTSADQFLVGIWDGPKALGLYGRAGQFILLPSHFLLGPLTGWMVSALSRLRDDPGRFRALNAQVTNASAHIIYPLAAVLITAPRPLINILLGHQWENAGDLLRWLAIALLAQPVLFAQNWLMMSHQHGRRLFLLAAAYLVVLVALCFAARSSGPEGIAVAVAVSSFIAILGVIWAVSGTPVRVMRDIATPLTIPFAVFCAVGITVAAVVHVNPASGSRSPAGIAAGLSVWAALALIFPKFRRELQNGFGIFFRGSGRLAAETG